MNFIKRVYFNVLTFLIRSIAILTGQLHAPWTKKKTSTKDVNKLMEILEDGDIILTRTEGEMTTLTIPGFWKHTIVYTGGGMVVEAVTPKVRETYLNDVIMKTDYYCVMRMKDLSKTEKEIFIEKARSYIGRYYDLNIDLFNEDQIFCSEIVFHGARKVKGVSFLEPRYRMGFPAFTPQDCYQAKRQFDLVLEKKD